VRADDLEHPDELRVDLDPVPGVEWPQIRRSRASCTRRWPMSGSSAGRRPRARAACTVLVASSRAGASTRCGARAGACARDVERRAPGLATSAWWKEERHGVFVDYNQNAKDRTVCSAYSVRPKPDARVSTPVSWEELDDCNPADFTLWTVPKRFQSIGDPHAGIDAHAGSLDALLELSARHEAEGHGDAPWPPHYRKGADEPTRAPPSTQRKKAPLIEIARADREADAEAAADAWKAAHPKVAALLAPEDVLIDRMRGSSSVSYRVRVNLTRCRRNCGRRRPSAPPQSHPSRSSRNLPVFLQRTWRSRIKAIASANLTGSCW
jgi:hypothetical protein